MTVWKLTFGTFDNYILISSREEAEKVVLAIKEFHEHPKVKSGEVYSYSMRIGSQHLYLGKDKNSKLALQEIEVYDKVPLMALSRKEIEIGLN